MPERFLRSHEVFVIYLIFIFKKTHKAAATVGMLWLCFHCTERARCWRFSERRSYNCFFYFELLCPVLLFFWYFLVTHRGWLIASDPAFSPLLPGVVWAVWWPKSVPLPPSWFQSHLKPSEMHQPRIQSSSVLLLSSVFAPLYFQKPSALSSGTLCLFFVHCE